MRIELRNLTKLPPVRSYNFDLHEDYGFIWFADYGNESTLFLNGQVCQTWPAAQHPNIHLVRWFNKEVAICESNFSTMLISVEGIKELHTSPPQDLFVSANYIFVGYSEEHHHRGGLDFVGDVVAAFTHEGKYLGGARPFLTKAIQPSIDELCAGYISGNSLIFLAYCEEMVFYFDPARMQLSYFPVTLPEPFSVVNARVFVGDEQTACAILSEKPTIEFAVFDLEKKKVEVRDFGPISKVLKEAGFALDKLTFRPSSTGRIIATDEHKAALVEISEFF